MGFFDNALAIKNDTKASSVVKLLLLGLLLMQAMTEAMPTTETYLYDDGNTTTTATPPPPNDPGFPIVEAVGIGAGILAGIILLVCLLKMCSGLDKICCESSEKRSYSPINDY